ncbi:MAG: DUF1501 domain-containing protein [Saprospiraceae bacterium]|nr:DUF1501 domain-containing protein [Saprospiraceae bacterium]
MKRRSFLKIFPAAASVSPFMVNGFSMRPFANRKMAHLLSSCDEVRERVLVLIQLKGGNDGLNTLIPIPRYDRYMQLRGTTGIAENKYIPLDGTLPGEDQVALHPAMTGVKALYDKGWASIVQGVGYDNMNQSHFKGTDLWLSGGGGAPALQNIPSGWMGRALQAFYPDVEGAPTPDMPDPLGIQVGDPNTSLGFHTETQHQNVINLSGQDVAGFYSLIQTIGGAPILNVPDTDQGAELEYIMGVEQSINQYAQRITQVFNNGSNAITTYPNNGFANQLKTVARMIRGGCQTKIYLCQLGGFDNHSAQVDSGDTSLGTHANLLKTLSDSVKTFFDDLEALGIADRVAACTFSEFGRCAKENGSFGTDHGTLAPMLLFGKGIRPSVLGTNVDLDDLTADNQLKNKQFDYRQVFATLLQDWLGASPFILEQTMFESYSKVFLVQKGYMVEPDCYYGDTTAIFDPFPKKWGPMSISPNPASFSVEITYQAEASFDAVLSLHSVGGSLVTASNQKILPGNNLFYLDVMSLPPGTYFARLQNKSTGKAEVAKVSVTR